jgi:hypothetical protein
MSQSIHLQPASSAGASFSFFAAALGVTGLAALLAGWLPVQVSVVTVFLFAGPHNWLEFRYFLTRMPAHWGRLRSFFLAGLVGALGLSAGFVALIVATRRGWLGEEMTLPGYSALYSLLVLWVALLAHLRSRQHPRRDWGWAWPVAFGLVALAWVAGAPFGVALVYLHPLLALWLLDRELRRSRPEWRGAYLACLACLPLFLGLLWWRLFNAPVPAPQGELAQRIREHAGAGALPGVSAHLLVATHTFLEMLHYGVWVVAIPLVGLRAAPWRLRAVPLAYRSGAWKRGVAVFLAAGLFAVAVLWGCFLFDYATTRGVYFTVAVVHVLAEFPFLLRSL